MNRDAATTAPQPGHPWGRIARLVTGPRRRYLEGAILVAILGSLLLAAAWVTGHRVQLSWDEAVYASKARSLVTSIPASHFLVYRPPGLPVLGVLAAPFGITDVTLRLVAALAGVGTLAVAWALARALWGAVAGLLAVLVLVANPIVLREIAVFRNDLLALAPLLLLLLLLWDQLERRAAPNAVLLAAAPLAAATFYLRFGLLPVLVGVAVAAGMLWAGPLWRHRRLVAGTIALTIALFLPHVIEAIARTGSPLGIVRSAVVVADTTTPLEAALRYLHWLPLRIAGLLGIGFVAAAGIAAAHAAWASVRARRLTPQARRLALLLVPTAVGAAAIVLVSHPEARYMLPPLVLVIIAGAGSVARLLGRIEAVPNVGRVARVAVTVALIGILIVTDALMGRQWAIAKRREARAQLLADAGAVVAREADGPCVAVATRVPIVGWYSGCLTVPFAADLGNARAKVPAGSPAYVVFVTDDPEFAAPELLDAYRRLAVEPPIDLIRQGSRTATIHLVPR